MPPGFRNTPLYPQQAIVIYTLRPPCPSPAMHGGLTRRYPIYLDCGPGSSREEPIDLYEVIHLEDDIPATSVGDTLQHPIYIDDSDDEVVIIQQPKAPNNRLQEARSGGEGRKGASKRRSKFETSTLSIIIPSTSTSARPGRTSPISTENAQPNANQVAVPASRQPRLILFGYHHKRYPNPSAMATTFKITDMGPSSIEATVVHVSVPENMYPHGTTIWVHLSFASSLYEATRDYIYFENQDAFIEPLEIHISLPTNDSENRKPPHVHVGSLEATPLRLSLKIGKGKCTSCTTFVGDAIKHRRVIKIEISAFDHTRVPALPYDLWMLITGLTLDLSSTPEEMAKSMRKIRSLNRPLKALVEETYLRRTVCADFPSPEAESVPFIELEFITKYLLRSPRRPAQNFQLRMTVTDFYPDIKPHAATIVSLTIHASMISIREIPILPSLAKLTLLNPQNRGGARSKVFINVFSGVVARCPVLRHLSASFIDFPERDSEYIFPPLETLELDHCRLTLHHGYINVVDCQRFMTLCQPRTLHIRGPLSYATTGATRQGPRSFPATLQLTGIKATELKLEQFTEIEKVIVNGGTVIKPLLSLEGEGLGHLEVIGRLTCEDQKAIAAWNATNYGPSISWRSVGYNPDST